MLRKIQSTLVLTLPSTFEFMLITETSLKNHTPENAIIIPGYKPFMKSREIQHEGGCLVYVRESISVTLGQDTMLSTVQDAVWVIDEMNDESFLVGYVCCLPGSLGICRLTLPAPNYLPLFLEGIHDGGWTQHVNDPIKTAMFLI